MRKSTRLIHNLFGIYINVNSLNLKSHIYNILKSVFYQIQKLTLNSLCSINNTSFGDNGGGTSDNRRWAAAAVDRPLLTARLDDRNSFIVVVMVSYGHGVGYH